MRAGPKPRVISGIIESVESEGLRQSGKSVQTTFRLVPMLSLLGEQRGSRIFQTKRVDEVVTEVLRAYGIAARWDLTRKYPVHEYITQYEESDLDFIHRLIAEAGIFYAFAHPVNAARSFLGALAEIPASAIADFAELAVSSAQRLAYPTETLVFGDDASLSPSIATSDAEELAEEAALTRAHGS